VLPNNIVLLLTIEKFETNLVLVNVNKLKPYKYMEFEVQKQKLQMLVYWEQSGGELQMQSCQKMRFEVFVHNDEVTCFNVVV
jgi:hypothetical protein